MAHIRKTLLYAVAMLSIAGTATGEGLSRNDILFTMPLDGNLQIINSSGTSSSEAVFVRKSDAVSHDFKMVEHNIPRFYPAGNGSTGLLVENGCNAFGQIERGTINFLASGAASCDDLKAFSSAGSMQTVLAPGLQGENALMLKSGAEGGSITTQPAKVDFKGEIIVSFYAKSVTSTDLTLSVGMAKETFKISSEWKRYFVGYKLKEPADVTMKFTLSGNHEVTIDALMLEPAGIYMKRAEPSTWMPGGVKRFSETLTVPLDFKGDSGAISFDFTLTAQGEWNSLMVIGSGWKPTATIRLRNNNTIQATLLGKTVKKSHKFETGKEYNLVLTWDKDSFVLYCDGEELLSASGGLSGKWPGKAGIGGSTDQASPNIKADAVIRNFTFWNRKLKADDAKQLKDKAPVDLLGLRGGVSMITPTRVFAQDTPVQLQWKLAKGLDYAVINIPGMQTQKKTADEKGLITLDFHPGLLEAGQYKINVTLPDGSVFPQQITVVPARKPWKNMQVCTWNEHGDYAQYGVDIIAGRNAWEADANAAKGLYSHDNINQLGIPRSDSDWAIAPDGSKSFPDIRSEQVRESVKTEISRLAELYRLVPDIRGAVLNSEKHAGSSSLNYSPEAIKYAKDRFGLDLNKWVNSDLRPWQRFQPTGYITTRPAPELVPADRIIPLDNPLYAFLRWWHSADGGTDVITNDITAEIILEARPDFLTMRDPALRRPQVRSYRKINVAQDWVYYTDPKNMLCTLERLQCLNRGRDDVAASAMPQFLFKPGMAAPFGGMPTADMFREACWLTCSRPARMMTFWNFKAAAQKGNQHTADEIETILGGQKNWDDTAKIIKSKKLDIRAWDPQLVKEFKAFNDNVWKPFGALFPRWHNSPRKVAVIRSFASNIFGNIRWGSDGVLGQAIISSGIPFDILWDEDFENGVNLDSYDLIAFPSCHAMTRPMYDKLSAYIKSGGTVVLPRSAPVKLDGAVTIKVPQKADNVSAQELALLKKYKGDTSHPQYVEGMEELVKTSTAGHISELDKLLAEKVKTPVKCNTANVSWNLLNAHGADYLVAVNDLRIPGKIYGRYGKVREQGVAQKASFTVNNPAWRYAYDLTARKALEIKNGRIDMNLGSCDGRIIMFTAQPVGKLSIKATDGIKRGQVNKLFISAGAFKTGLLPVKIDIIRPDKSLSPFSCYAVLENGTLTFKLPVATNAPAGKWTVEVTELATGGKATFSFDI
ncbi:MAG: hypothetical protein JXR78_08860 [Victivallales bacterium]|nr:hypothetical protein [Victivallales bacterium]